MRQENVWRFIKAAFLQWNHVEVLLNPEIGTTKSTAVMALSTDVSPRKYVFGCFFGSLKSDMFNPENSFKSAGIGPLSSNWRSRIRGFIIPANYSELYTSSKTVVSFDVVGMEKATTSFRRLEGQRWVSLILDCSEAMKDTDMPPNRLIRMMVLLPNFINQFFDMNPLSQLQIIETSDGLAKIVSPMSGTTF